jgi:hypothetical protein
MTTIRKLPRKILIDGDNRGGRYPTIARTDDKRLGNNNVYYNDTLTNLFLTGSIVNFPTTLPTGSRYLENVLTTSLYLTSSVRPASIENFINFNPQDQTFTPFKEFGLQEQDIKNSEFYATGSKVEDVGLGFTNNLGDKTQIRLELSIDTQTMMLAQTASLLYYNVDKKRFEQLPDVQNAPGRDKRLMDLSPFYGTPEFADICSDSRLFNCFGTNTISGSVLSSSILQESAIVNSAVSLQTAPQLLQVRDNANSTLNSIFAATSSQIIKMSNYIAQPFLLEKAIIELPIKAGPGWCLDRTSAENIYVGVDANPTALVALDAGGPAITVSLLNQLNDHNRDIIMSATIIPQNDNTIYGIYKPQNDPSYFNRLLFGYPAFSTPEYVVKHSANGFFTGSTVLKMQSACNNGLIVYNVYIDYDYTGSSQLFHFHQDDSFIVGVDPIGRNMSTVGSGRSYFGKEYSSNIDFHNNLNKVIQVLGNNRRNTILSSTVDFNNIKICTDADFSINVLQDNKPSPYILFPNDNLILAVSKFRPQITSINGTTTGGDMTTFNWAQVVLTSSHDVGINTGTIKLSLYGSLIKTETEFHDTLNTPLISNAIHEVVGNETVLDQFDVEYNEQLLGMTTDDIVVGTFGSSDNYSALTFENTQDRIVVGLHRRDVDPFYYQNARFSSNRIYPYIMLQQQNRNYKFFDTKQYWDSFAPSISDILKVDNSDLIFDQIVGGKTGFIGFDDPVPVYSAHVDFNWSKSFPYTDLYADLKRNFSLDKLLVTVNFNGELIEPFYTKLLRIQYGQIALKFALFQEVSYLPPNTNVSIQKLENVYKIFFGFGNKNIMFEYNSKLYGSTTVPDFINYQADKNIAIVPIVRGWKYGMIQGFPLSPSIIFRRDHFGQPRDMLEQMLYTKFYDPIGISDEGIANGVIGPLAAAVQVKFVDNLGKITQPNKTFSSNLSFEATSSLPYFDGIVKNREEPLNLQFNNLTFVPSET